MAIDLPNRFALDEFPALDDGSKKINAPRAIEVALVGGTSIAELVDGLKEAQNAQVTLGKKPAIILDGKKAINLRAIPNQKCLLFRQPAKQERSQGMKLAAVFSLKDTAAREKLATSQSLDMNDPALLALQQNLAQHAQNKESNTTLFVKDNSKLPPAKSGKQALKANSLAFLKPHRQGLFDKNPTNNNSRSAPGSPSLGGLTPPVPSRPSQKLLKQEAMKTSLIHLLAVRAVSKAYVLKCLGCKPDVLEPLLEKYGRPSRFDANKLDLSDRGYKELDVWNFPYKEQEERQAAIERAITAYDRQRISVVEIVWQMLLPKEERGKGKVLSKLKLHGGPISRVGTPQIQVEATGATRESTKSGSPEANDDRGRLAPSSALGGPRSSSQDASKKQKASELEAQSKRLFAKNPAKPAKATKAKDTKTKEKEAPKAPTAKKAAPKRAAGATNSKVKSEEFVHDSDDDIEMEDAAPPTPKPSVTKPEAKKSLPTTSQTKAARTDPVKKAVAVPQKAPPAKEKSKDPKVVVPKAVAPKQKNVASKKPPPPTSAAAAAAKPLPQDVAPAAVPMSRNVSHKRTSSSPIKPSPLGSSPPTNASDLENDNVVKSYKSSSSSNSPLINHRRPSRDVDLASSKKSASRTNAAATTAQAASTVNPERAQKRKAGALEADGHTSVPSRSPAAKSLPSTKSAPERPAKRQQTSSVSGASTSSSDRGATGGDRSPLLSQENLKYSRQFKELQSKYVSHLRELSALSNPPVEKVQKLHRMYEKLSAHKAHIWKLAAV